MLRFVHRTFSRHVGLWLALVGATLVAVAGMTVSDLRAEAAERRDAQIAFLELAGDTQDLNRIVLESLAAGRAKPEVFSAVEANGKAIDAQLERDIVKRDGSQAGVLKALDALITYRGVAERLLAALGHGNRHAGGADEALG